jgi:hypothetical protein
VSSDGHLVVQPAAYIISTNFTAAAIFYLQETLTLITKKKTVNLALLKMSLDCLKNLDELQEKYFFRLPYAYIIADYVWPGIIMSGPRVQKIQDMEFGPDDVVIASYPKSGIYWSYYFYTIQKNG